MRETHESPARRPEKPPLPVPALLASALSLKFYPSPSMSGLEVVVAKLQDDPVTEPIASEIGGASGLSHFRSTKNHLGKFYSPSTAMTL